ncbi:MAG: nucleotide exchange factor GrpE [Bacteroidales bacterium]|jgi:molecular chaperone GrpE|nr:nucleotide exchange factor GrpE [Bacteroidales bacterium]MDP2238489.1 nucleotide exchange factor GrpE [Bacteroidales bacterium]
MDETKKTDPKDQMEDFEDIHIEENEAFLEEKPIEETDMKLKQDKKKVKKDKASEELENLQLKYDELNEKYLRLFSEFDNFRKRTLKEKIELSKTASEDIITNLLPIIDDFERALQLMPQTEENRKQFEGINLIYNKLSKTLQQKGLEELTALGEAFDTDYHEALTNIPAADESMKGKVVDVIQKGYNLNGKIIRFAKVVVGN